MPTGSPTISRPRPETAPAGVADMADSADRALGVPIVRLPQAAGLALPAYATPGSAGLDLLAAIASPLVLAPGQRALVPTGIAIALPPGYEAQIRPRSGLALKYGLAILNSPGTIDSDYRGEVGVILANLGAEPVTLERGQRIAQLVVGSVARVAWDERATLPETHFGAGGRSAGGFGSTGA